MQTEVGDVYTVPISHGEGRFIIKDELLKQLESLKEESILMLRSMMDCDVFQKDLHALRIVIKYIKDGGIK